MTYRPRASCKRCGKPRSAVGHLSRRGNCLECGLAEQASNQQELAAHAGPAWERWREAMVDYVASLYGGTVAPDTLTELEHELERSPL